MNDYTNCNTVTNSNPDPNNNSAVVQMYTQGVSCSMTNKLLNDAH